MGKVTVAFSASGYGSETQSFKSRDEAVESIKNDAAGIAATHGITAPCGGSRPVGKRTRRARSLITATASGS